MAIITQQIAKDLLQITVSTWDALIATLIPKVQKSVVRYTHNSFLNLAVQIESSAISFVNSSKKIVSTDLDFTDYDFIVGDYKITGSKHNNNIVHISTVAVLELTSDDTIIDEDEDFSIRIVKVDFPDELHIEVAQYIKYLISTHSRNIKSESLPGGYSVSFTSEVDLLKSLFSKYRKLYQ